MTDTFTFESGRVYHLDVLPVPEISSNYAGHVAIPEQKSHQDAAYAAGLCINNTTNEVIADVNPYTDTDLIIRSTGGSHWSASGRHHYRGRINVRYVGDVCQ